MQVVLPFIGTRKSIHVKRNIIKKRLMMSKEKHEAWRSMRANDMAKTAPLVTGADEDALHTLWSSERRELIDGKWYVPISEVAAVLHTTTVEPLSEEWQARTFENLRIGEDGPILKVNWLRDTVESEPNDMRLGGRVRARYWKERNREES
jgi:hypothetical protein